jgi:hypothetical protein
VTVTEDARDGLETARPDQDGTGIPARRTAFDDLADQAARLPWAWPALLTLVFGFYQVGRPELWRDELASWSFASRSVPELIAAARHTGATQFAYYLLLHVWISAFGDSADVMRAPSVLAMAAAAACVALVGRRLAGPRAGLISGLVFALVPSVSRFAQEVRFYAFAVLAVTLATLLLLRALDRPSPPRWLGYAASLALVGYIDVVALSVVAGHIAGAVLRCWYDRDNRQLWFLAAVAGGMAACVPAVLAGVTQAKSQITWIARPGLDLTDFAFFGRNLFYSTSVAAALIMVAVLAWAVAWREAAFMTALAIGPVAVVWLISQGSYSYFFPRYLLFTVAAWAVLAGIGLAGLPGQFRHQVHRLRGHRGLRGRPGPGRRRHYLPGTGPRAELAADQLRHEVLPGPGHASRSAGPARAPDPVRGPGRHPVPGALPSAGRLPGRRTEDMDHRRRPRAPPEAGGDAAPGRRAVPALPAAPGQARARPDRLPAHPGAVTIPGEEPASFGALVFVVTTVSTVD